ncbi:hypothetical protein [Shimazuella alba]|uniref:Uncharacterized protein n=1 Tax=Shimazuella alba TaxID=2690964 RepID=A0A6I4VX38_9BACL|nr:hypothetical protein [Shimazuella alba]MXQ54446.1 hypothetical protein [Shimazuella alba]
MATVQAHRRSRTESKWADRLSPASAVGVVKSTREAAAQVSKPIAIRYALSQ